MGRHVDRQLSRPWRVCRRVCGTPHTLSCAWFIWRLPGLTKQSCVSLLPPRYHQVPLCPSYHPRTRSSTTPFSTKMNPPRRDPDERERRRARRPSVTLLMSRSSRTRLPSRDIKKRLKFSCSDRVRAVSQRASRATHIFDLSLTHVCREVHDDQEYVLFPFISVPLSDREQPSDFQLKYAYSAWARERSSWKTVM